jgi:hypothetical protein
LVFLYRPAFGFSLPAGGGTTGTECLEIKAHNLITLAPEQLPDTFLKRLKRDRDE